MNPGGLGSEGSSGISSESVFRDSSSSKRLGSAESATSGFSSSPPVFSDANSFVDQNHTCTGCIAKDACAVAKCFDCGNFLCANCVMAHHTVARFEGHHIVILGEVASRSSSPNETVDLDALTKIIAEGKIKATEISKTKNLEAISFRLSSQYRKAFDEVNETFQFYVSMLQERKTEVLKELEQSFSNKQVALSVYGRKARDTSDKIHQVTDFGDRLLKHACPSEILLFKKPIETRLHQLVAYMPPLNVADITELEFIANFQAIQAGVKNQFGYVKTKQEVDGSQRQPPICPPSGLPSKEGHLVDSSTCPSLMELTDEPSTHHQDSQKKDSDVISPIMNMGKDASFIAKTDAFGGRIKYGKENISHGMPAGPITGLYGTPTAKELFTPTSQFASTPIKMPASSLLGPLHNSSSGLPSLLKGSYKEDCATNPYDAWTNSSDNLFSGLAVGSNNHVPSSYGSSLVTPSSNHVASLPYLGLSSNFATSFNTVAPHSLSNLSSDFTSPTDVTSIVYPAPAKSHIKRQKMIYHCKFGEFGILEDQFTEPSGVAVNAQNDIIVADTNNHKIKIFDKEGRFKFQFGEVGKRDDQILYPNRVAVFKNTGDIVVTERSPTHQVQIYTKYGQFIRKFGATVLQHPRGVCVDSMGRVIVVECKVMRVVIFDHNGNLLKKFGCSQYLHFPNGVVVNDRQEIFISDNRAHCVKVFDYEGNYLRQIGGEGITNYPIGVGINSAGEITIADNHNNFNLSVFSQDGQLISALESKVKHAQCFDVSLMDDGSVVLASKDYRLYIYRYIQVPPSPTGLQMWE